MKGDSHLILLLFAWFSCSALLRKGKIKDGSNLIAKWSFTDHAITMEFDANFEMMKTSLACQWRITPFNECPSFVLWWDKSVTDEPSLSVTAGCNQIEKEPKMRFELVGDWDRIQDEVIGKEGSRRFHFKGTRTFEGELSDFGAGVGYNNFRYIMEGNKGRIDKNIKIAE